MHSFFFLQIYAFSQYIVLLWNFWFRVCCNLNRTTLKALDGEDLMSSGSVPWGRRTYFFTFLFNHFLSNFQCLHHTFAVFFKLFANYKNTLFVPPFIKNKNFFNFCFSFCIWGLTTSLGKRSGFPRQLNLHKI